MLSYQLKNLLYELITSQMFYRIKQWSYRLEQGLPRRAVERIDVLCSENPCPNTRKVYGNWKLRKEVVTVSVWLNFGTVFITLITNCEHVI